MPTIYTGQNTTGSPAMTYGGAGGDTKILESTPSTNYQTDTVLEVSKYSAGNNTITLIKFPGLSNITGPVTVSSATMYFYSSGGANGASPVYEMRRLLRNVVYNQATWNVFSTGNNWGTAGGRSDGVDRVATVSGSWTDNQPGGSYYGFTGSGLATDVESWINGTNTNNGWHIERQGTGNDSNYSQFVADGGADGQRPYLEVIYTTGGGGGGGRLVAGISGNFGLIRT